jgi:hypothetical protein
MAMRTGEVKLRKQTKQGDSELKNQMLKELEKAGKERQVSRSPQDRQRYSIQVVSSSHVG